LQRASARRGPQGAGDERHDRGGRSPRCGDARPGDQRRRWRASIPEERLAAAGVGADATTLLLTRSWRWRGDGLAVVKATIAAAATLPEDGPWP
jgi:hypothetical protein